MAAAPGPRWLTLALAFLNAYDDARVTAALKKTLAMPTGMAWIWWGVRTSFANLAKVKWRIQKIAGVVTDLDISAHSRPSARARRGGLQ